MTLHKIKFNNLNLSFRERGELLFNFNKTLKSGSYLMSNKTLEFQKKFSDYINQKYVVSCANGTDGLYLALASLKLKPGTEVLMTSNCGMYAASAAVRLLLVPKFVDIDYVSGQIDLNALLSGINIHTKVLIITHLYGISNKMNLIKKICEDKKIILIEDVSQACGASFHDKKLGTYGLIGTFSFYPTKNLAALGDGGAVITSDKNVYEEIKKLKQYGWSKKYFSTIGNGINSRIDEIQASILISRLARLDKDNLKRQLLLDSYQACINNSEIKILGSNMQLGENVAHLAVLRSNQIKKIKNIFRKKNIETMVHYPVPDHMQPSLKNKIKISGRLLNTEKFVNEILSIPCNSKLKRDEILHIKHTLSEL